MAQRPEDPGGGRRKRKEPNGLVFMGAGLEFAASVGLLAWFGHWIDATLETDYLFTMLGFAMGLVGGTYRLWKMGKRFF